VPWGQVAVLARKRSHFARIEAALRRREVPCEVVGLGGLLTRPEVLDVVATLRVLADPSAGSALVRILSGPRWRIGPRDLARLGGRAALLARRRHGDDGTARTSSAAGTSSAAPPAAESAAMTAAQDAVVAYDAADDRSLVDALDDLGPPAAYSPEGYGRLVALRDDLRQLRPWTAQPLPDLVAAVVRLTGLDVELAARPGTSYADALADLDRLVEVAEEFVAEADDARLTSFLAYLDAAEEREDGLEPDQPELGSERVQLMTVHAAKGLEWDVVVVAGAVTKVFPVEGQQVANWTTQVRTLPFDLRGDRLELPELAWRTATDQPGARKALDAFADACRERALTEEQRLAYVAVTRPRKHLLVTGYWWDHTSKPRGPSSLLQLVARVTTECGRPPRLWTTRPDDEAVNPFTAEGRAAAWPLDPLGPSTARRRGRSRARPRSAVVGAHPAAALRAHRDAGAGAGVGRGDLAAARRARGAAPAAPLCRPRRRAAGAAQRLAAGAAAP
jgi:DNA helicase-2/ATP-dependent DNA helicase PcrA